MNVFITTEEKTEIVTIEGSIDSKTSAKLQTEIMEKISDIHCVLMDMAKVDFVSSAGLRVLLMLYRQIKIRNGKIILSGVSDEIKDVMEMTGFISFFEFTEKVEEALLSFQ
jgi:anti-sigma B factor antagonist